MSTPSKRRKTSPTTYVGTSNQEERPAQQPPTKAVTPKRASYQSPTKASLARSNPNVLQRVAQAKEKRETEPNRRRSLREALLGNQNIPPDSTAVKRPDPQTTDSTNPAESAQILSTERGPIDLDVANIFRDIPRQTPIQEVAHAPESQSPIRTTPHRNGIIPYISPTIVPKLVKSANASQRQQSRSSSAELPPTPVQLGNHPRPERPRGLASSSPGGSGRERTRLRDGQTTSSPLKPRTPAPPRSQVEQEVDHAEIASGVGDEPGQENSQPVRADGTELEEDTGDHIIQEKRQQLQSLQNRLKELRQDCRKLTSLSKAVNETEVSSTISQRLEPHLALVLESDFTRDQYSSPRLEDHDLFKKHPLAFLTLFSPNGLRLTCLAYEQFSYESPKRVYQITSVAPEPWPASAFAFSFEVVTDMVSGKVEQIMLMNTSNQPPVLGNWINHRLKDPVLNTDLATIIAGIGRYHEEDIKRAIIFKRFSEEQPLASNPVQKLELQRLSTAEALSLLPYMGMIQRSFTSTRSTTQPRRPRGTVAQLMLTYEIELDWVGQSSTKIDICATGFSTEVMKHARELFREVEAIDGVEPAFETVRDVLGMNNLSKVVDGTTEKMSAVKTKGKKKARRMTEFT